MLDTYFEDIAEKLEEQDINIWILTYPWIMSLFTHSIPLNLSNRLWDIIFEYQWNGFFKIVYGILEVWEDDIINNWQTLNDFMIVFNKIKDDTSSIHNVSIHK